MEKSQSARLNRAITLSKTENKSVRFLVSWINTDMELKLKSLDELRTGSVYCQMMHKMCPHAILLSKIYFDTGIKRECEANFKLLEKSFEKVLTGREISGFSIVPISKLVIGQGHLDFARWYYTFYQNHINPIDVASYEAEKLRQFSRKCLKKTSTSLTIMESTRNLQKEILEIRYKKSYLNIAEFCKECRNVPLPPSDSEREEIKKKAVLRYKRQSVDKILQRHIRRSAMRLAAVKAFNMNESRLQDPRLDANVQLIEAKAKIKELHGISLKHSKDLIRTLYEICESMRK